MIIEKLLSLILSLPIFKGLALSTTYVDNLITVLSSLGFISNFVDIGTAIKCSLFIIAASSVAFVIKFILTII